MNAPASIIGIGEQDRAAIAQGLSRLLADTYAVPDHATSAGTSPAPCSARCTPCSWRAVPRTVERGRPDRQRIRSLGHVAPGSRCLRSLSSLPDAPEQPPRALEMVRILVQGHEAVARTTRALFHGPTPPATGPRPIADQRTRCTSRPPGCCAPYWRNRLRWGPVQRAQAAIDQMANRRKPWRCQVFSMNLARLARIEPRPSASRLILYPLSYSRVQCKPGIIAHLGDGRRRPSASSSPMPRKRLHRHRGGGFPDRTPSSSQLLISPCTMA